jgi:hypothetical protein
MKVICALNTAVEWGASSFTLVIFVTFDALIVGACVRGTLAVEGAFNTHIRVTETISTVFVEGALSAEAIDAGIAFTVVVGDAFGASVHFAAVVFTIVVLDTIVTNAISSANSVLTLSISVAFDACS